MKRPGFRPARSSRRDDSIGAIHLDDDTWSIPVTSAWTNIARRLSDDRRLVEFETRRPRPIPGAEVPRRRPEVLAEFGRAAPVREDVARPDRRSAALRASPEDDHSRPMSHSRVATIVRARRQIDFLESL
jgi:hypothetical protein